MQIKPSRPKLKPSRKNRFNPGDVVIHDEKRIIAEVVSTSHKWAEVKILRKNGDKSAPVLEIYAYHHLRLFMSIEKRLDMAKAIEKKLKRESTGILGAINRVKKRARRMWQKEA